MMAAANPEYSAVVGQGTACLCYVWQRFSTGGLWLKSGLWRCFVWVTASWAVSLDMMEREEAFLIFCNTYGSWVNMSKEKHEGPETPSVENH